MRIAFYEDVSAEQFGPLALTRPLCEFRCGLFTQRERFLRSNPISEWGCFTRDIIQNVYSIEQPAAYVNDYQWLSKESTLLINSRWVPCSANMIDVESDEIGICDGVIVYVTLHPDEGILLSTGSWSDAMSKIAQSRRFVSVEGTLFCRPWDIVEQNSQQIIEDFKTFKIGAEKQLLKSSFRFELLGDESDLWISSSATIDPYVVIDTTGGPVVIESDVHVSSFTKISGPCTVGAGSMLERASLKPGVSIGPECRLGGEIESSIFHSHVNKYHAGFLGHSYICPWVNMGAMTTNSDLKNDYSSVSVPINDEYLATELSKVGCFIGDHAKTALGSLFNTGTTVGPFAVMLPSGDLLPKYIPPYAFFRHGELQDLWPLERYLKTAEIVMGRRNVQMTQHHKKLYSFLYDNAKNDKLQASHKPNKKESLSANQSRQSRS